MQSRKIKEKIDNCADHVRWIGELFLEYADKIDLKSDDLEKFDELQTLMYCQNENMEVVINKVNQIVDDLNEGVGRVSYN